MKLNEKYKKIGIENIIEEIDDDICRIFDKYIKKGFVSENGKLFFEDDELLTRFEYHLGGLQRLIVDTYDIPYSLVNGENRLEFNFENCYDDVKASTKAEFIADMCEEKQDKKDISERMKNGEEIGLINPDFKADMEAQDEKFGEHKI